MCRCVCVLVCACASILLFYWPVIKFAGHFVLQGLCVSYYSLVYMLCLCGHLCSTFQELLKGTDAQVSSIPEVA